MSLILRKHYQNSQNFQNFQNSQNYQNYYLWAGGAVCVLVIATIVVVYTASPVHSTGPPGPGPETTPSPTPNTPPPVALPPPTSTPHTPSPGPVAVIPPPIDTSSTSLYLYIGLSILGLVVALATFYAVRKKGGVSGILRVQRASKRVEAIRSSTDTNIQGVLKGVPFVLLCFAQYNNRELEKMFKNCQTVYPRELTPGNIVALIARFEQVERETKKDFKSKDSFVVRAFKKFSEFKSQLQPITQNRAIQIILGILSCPGNDRYKRGLDPSILPSAEQIQQATQRITDEQQHELDQLRTQQEQLRRQGFDQAAAEKQREIDLLRGQLEQSKQTERLLQTNQQTLQVEVSDLKTSRQSIQSQLTDANKALETERQKNVEFQKTLTGIQKTLTDIQNEQKTGEANRVDLQTRLNTLTAAQHTLETELEVARNTGTLLQGQLNEARNLNGNIQKEKETIQAKLQETQITLATSKSDLRNLQERFINMEKSLVEEQKNGSLTKTDLTNARLELERAKKDLETTKKQLETTIENLKTRKKKSKETQQKLEDSKNQLAKLDKTLAVVENNLDWTKRMYETELTKVSNEYEKSRQDLIQAQQTAKGLKTQLDQNQKELNELKNKNDINIIDLALVAERLKQAQKDLNNANVQTQDQKKINESILKQKDQIQQEANKRVEQLTNRFDQTIKELQQEMKRVQETEKNTTVQNATLTEQLKHKMQELQRISVELQTAKNNAQDLGLSRQKIETELNETKQVQSRLNNEIKQLQKNNDELLRELLTEKNKLNNQLQSLLNKTDQLNVSEKDRETLANKIKEIEQKLIIANRNYDLISDANEEIKKEMDAMKAQKRQIENKIDRVRRGSIDLDNKEDAELQWIKQETSSINWKNIIQNIETKLDIDITRRDVNKTQSFTKLLDIIQKIKIELGGGTTTFIGANTALTNYENYRTLSFDTIEQTLIQKGKKDLLKQLIQLYKKYYVYPEWTFP